MKSSFISGAIKWGVILIFAVIAISSCTAKIHQGNVGIVYSMNGGVESVPLDQGWKIVAPWKKVTEYPVSTEIAYYNNGDHEGRKSDDSIVIGTKDGKTIRVDMQISYHMDAAKLPHVFNKFRGQEIQTIEYGYMRQNAQRIANDISSHYTMMDIVGEKKAEYNSQILKQLTDFFDDDGIIIEQAGLGKVEPDAQTAQAIQAVANAQYAQRQAEYEKQAATAQALTVVEKAKGEAEAKRIQADAEAYKNQKLAQSTDARVVELEWVKKWDGKLPQYMLGDKTLMQLK